MNSHPAPQNLIDYYTGKLCTKACFYKTPSKDTQIGKILRTPKGLHN